jgi:Pycsar effector protein
MEDNWKYRAEVAMVFFNHVESQVGLATNKTALLIAANAFIVPAYLTLLKEFADKVPSWAIQPWYVTVGLAFLLLALASTFSLWAVLPTLRPRPIEPTRRNLVFFGHVGSFGMHWEEYINRFQNANPEELLRDILAQAHAKSFYLARMFWWLRLGVILTIASLLTFAMATGVVIGAKIVG